MAKFLFYCTLFAVIFTEGILCKSHRKVKQNDDNDVKIVGGNETTIETYPYQAYLLLYDGRDYYQCGGSIISKNSVVTAAHCLAGMQRIYVRIGTTNSGSGGTEYETTSFFSHPLYNSRTYDYDAGVVRVSRGMNLDGINARAITMVDTGYDPKEDEDIILTGWGATSVNNMVSNRRSVNIMQQGGESIINNWLQEDNEDSDDELQQFSRQSETARHQILSDEDEDERIPSEHGSESEWSFTSGLIQVTRRHRSQI